MRSLDKKFLSKHSQKLDEIMERLQEDEPLEYILGFAQFYEHQLKVTKDTLIPRVETEGLVELAKSQIYERLFNAKSQVPNSKSQDEPSLHIVDVGTGSGCIILALATSFREPIKYYATDIDSKALEVARENIETYDLDEKISLFRGNLLDPISPNIKFDIIVANLPYIPKHDLPVLDNSVKDYEPTLALDGGMNGASVIRELLVQAKERLAQDGAILLELSSKVVEPATKFTKRFYPKAKIWTAKDVFDRERYLVIESSK